MISWHKKIKMFSGGRLLPSAEEIKPEGHVGGYVGGYVGGCVGGNHLKATIIVLNDEVR